MKSFYRLEIKESVDSDESTLYYFENEYTAVEFAQKYVDYYYNYTSMEYINRNMLEGTSQYKVCNIYVNFGVHTITETYSIIEVDKASCYLDDNDDIKISLSLEEIGNITKIYFTTLEDL